MYLFGCQSSYLPSTAVVSHIETVLTSQAVSFDDGPYQYTEAVLDKFKAAGQHATFFVNGQNYGNIYSYNSTLKRMISEGHQIGSHTWDHKDLTTLDTAGITSEMVQIEVALDNILGYHAKYMRPPYLSTNPQVEATLGSLGYYIIDVDIDTLDWQYGPEGQIATSEKLYSDGVNGGGTISLEHDPLPDTANTLVPYILSFLASKNLQSVTVAECLGDTNSPYVVAKGGALSSASASASQSASASSTKPASSTKLSNSSTKPATSVVATSSKASSVPATSSKATSVPATSSKAASVPATSSKAATSSVKAASSTAKTSSAAPVASGKASPDGTCGGTNKVSNPLQNILLVLTSLLSILAVRAAALSTGECPAISLTMLC